LDEDAFERLLYKVRRRTENEIDASEIEGKEDFYVPSLSCRTIVYKGLMLAPQIEKFYFELADPLVTSALCLVHQRFSTNTFPSWKLAHPYRYMAHNGEINTIRGNVSWMNARQSVLDSPLYGEEIRQAVPGHYAGRQRLGFAGQRGRVSLPVGPFPAPRDGHADSRGLVRQPGHGRGEARLLRVPRLADGTVGRAGGDLRLRTAGVIGATLDRNGLRPGRYIVTKDDLVVLASEAGVIEVPPEDIRKKGRLRPGRMFLVDTVQQRIISDSEIKKQLAGRQPYADWLKQQQVTIDQAARTARA
jgi:glutamate synthase (NADPH/NADH) large chain